MNYPRYVYRSGEGASTGVLVNSPEELQTLPADAVWVDAPAYNDLDDYAPKRAPRPSGPDPRDARIAELERMLAERGAAAPDGDAAAAAPAEQAEMTPAQKRAAAKAAAAAAAASSEPA